MKTNLLKETPKLLIYLRLLIAFILLVDGLNGKISFYFIPLFIIAFLSDVFDGIIARKLKVSTDSLRKADSIVDSVLYACVALSAYFCRRDLFHGFESTLLILSSLQLISWIYSLLKFQKLTSYHSYFAKAWGITLFMATIAIFSFNYTGIILCLTIIVGAASIVEDVAITFILPEWKVDVLSIQEAFKLREAHSKNISAT